MALVGGAVGAGTVSGPPQAVTPTSPAQQRTGRPGAACGKEHQYWKCW